MCSRLLAHHAHDGRIRTRSSASGAKESSGSPGERRAWLGPPIFTTGSLCVVVAGVIQLGSMPVEVIQEAKRSDETAEKSSAAAA